MAITDTAHDATKITRFYGLSTDTKPAQAMIGARFQETDTRKSFVFIGEWVRDETVTVVQDGPVIVREVLATDDLLGQVLTEIKLTNAYLALVTGDELNEEDISDVSD